MATYYVDKNASAGGNGSAGSPWKTLAQAVDGVSNGDTVRIKPGKYSETLQLDTPAKHSNTTWMADNANNRPMIDGGYSIALMTGSGNNVSMPLAPGGGQGALMSTKEGVINATFDGIIVQNSPGDGIACNGHGTTVQNCVVYFTYRNGLMVNPPGAGRVNGLTVKNTKIIKTSVRFLANRDQGSAAVILRELHEPVLFQDVEVAYGHGESFDIDKPSSGTESQKLTFERMLIHDSNHTTLYFNQSRYVIVRDSSLFYSHQGADLHGGNTGERGYTIRFKDENSDYPNNSLGYIDIYNNLFVNGGGLLIVGGGGRATHARALYVGANTFVGGNWTTGNLPIKYQAEPGNRNEGIFENNIVDLTAASGFNSNVGQISGDSTIVIRNNLWSHTPHASMRGTNSIFENPRLANPGALIVTSNYFTAAMDSWEKVTTTTNFNPNNYKPQSNSPAIGAGSTGGNATNTNPTTFVPTRARQVDRSGTNRGAVPDIGAWEYQTGGGPEPTITAFFTRTPGSGNAPLTVQFTDASSTSGGASITSRLWDFGDGTTSTATNPSKAYSAAGTYTPTLTITDSVNGLSNSFTGAAITVTAGGSIIAFFTRTPAAAEVGEMVAFTDASTVTGDAVIDTWLWNFRDGTTSALPNPTHVFTAAGAYQVRLIVSDSVRGYTHTWTGPTTLITESPPADGVEAGFSQSPASGQAPLSVSFTDTSQAAGAAVINSWAWSFGDGSNSTSQNPTHIYTEPGTYQATLTVRDTVRGLVGVFTGATITVTAEAPPGAGGDVVLRQVRAALNTSDGNQTFTQTGLGGLTPKSARFIVTGATNDGVAANGELFAYGATAEGNQWSACIAAEHGAADTNAARMWTDGACLLLIAPNGAEVMRATFVAWTTNGVTINIDWTGTPAAYLCTVVFGAGTEYEAWVGTAALGLAGDKVVEEVNFEPAVVRGVATWGSKNVGESDATLSLGLAHRLGGQYVLERYYTDGLPDALNRTRLFEGEIAHSRYSPGGRAGITISAWSGNGFTVLAKSDVNSAVLLMAERLGDVNSRVALASSATAAGSMDYATGWNPQYAEHLISPRQGLGSNNDNAISGTTGVHTVTADGEFSNEVSGENGSATTNEQSLSDNQLIVVDHTGATLTAGATTLGTGKYTINYSAAPGTAQVWPALVVETGQSPGGGGGGAYVTAQFEVNVNGGEAPLQVAFTDLSSSTNPIISWLWDFGDGGSSTVKNPTHVYQNAGNWTVTLTVSDGTLTNVKVREDLIQTVAATTEEFLVGPFWMRPITEDSTGNTYTDPQDEANAGYMTAGLALESLKLGEWEIYPDEASGTLKVKFADGTIKTVTMT